MTARNAQHDPREGQRTPGVTIRKVGGNDAYSWAVLRNGHPIPSLTGLSRGQAQYYRDQIKAGTR